MLMKNIFFSLSSIFLIFFALKVVTSKNPVHSILSLILVFFNGASLLIALRAEFIAMLFVIVYVGAVAVLFLFVIMMLNVKVVNSDASIYRYTPIFCISTCIFFIELSVLFYPDLISLDVSCFCLLEDNFLFEWNGASVPSNNINILGGVLYTNYFYLLMLSGLILLVSMLGAICLTLHRRNDTKKQIIYKQIERDFSSSVSWRS